MSNRYSIVAMKPLGTEEIVAALQPGAAVTLVREPFNKFDANAVMVWVDGKHVGYIPKATNKHLAQFIDANGRAWMPPHAAITVYPMAQDQSVRVHIEGAIALDARFVRSPNSNYPQVEV